MQIQAGTSKKLLIETVLPENFKFYVRFSEDGRNHFFQIVNEFLRKMSPRIHESLSPSRLLHELPEAPTCYHQNFKDPEADPQVFSSSFAGVSGILRRREYDRTSVHALRNQAFSDLQALMNSAADVLSVLEKYSSSIVKGARKDRTDLFTILPICYLRTIRDFHLTVSHIFYYLQ